MYPTYPDELIDTVIKDMNVADMLQFYHREELSSKYNRLYKSKSYYLEDIIKDMEDIEDMNSMPEYFDSFWGKRYKQNIPACNNMDDLLAYRVFKIVRLNLITELSPSYQNDRLFAEKYKQAIRDDIQKIVDKEEAKKNKSEQCH